MSTHASHDTAPLFPVTPRRLVLAVVAVLAGGIAYGYMTAESEAVHVDPAAAYFPVDMPRYPGATEFPMSSEMSLNGSQLFQSYFYTEDAPEKVLSWYRSVWETQGYEVFATVYPESGEGHLHVVDQGMDYRKGVTVRREGKRTLALPSAVRGIAAFLPPEADTTFPQLDGSRAITRMESFENGQRARTYLYANDRNFDDNVAYVRSEMSKAGWREVKRLEPGRGELALAGDEGSREGEDEQGAPSAIDGAAPANPPQPTSAPAAAVAAAQARTTAAMGAVLAGPAKAERGTRIEFTRPSQQVTVDIIQRETGGQVAVNFVEVNR